MVSLRRVLLLPVLLIVVLAGLTIYTAISHATALRQSQQDISHTHQVVEATQALFSSAQDAELGQRGYLLTHDLAYLEPWRQAARQMPEELGRLKALVADNPD